MEGYARFAGNRNRQPGEHILKALGIDMVESMSEITRVMREFSQVIDALDEDQFKQWCLFVEKYSGDYQDILVATTRFSGRELTKPLRNKKR